MADSNSRQSSAPRSSSPPHIRVQYHPNDLAFTEESHEGEYGVPVIEEGVEETGLRDARRGHDPHDLIDSGFQGEDRNDDEVTVPSTSAALTTENGVQQIFENISRVSQQLAERIRSRVPETPIQPGNPPLQPQDAGSHTANSREIDLDIRALEYTSPVDSNLMCPICHSPFVKPVRLFCDHVFCEECLGRAFESNSSHSSKTCPTCRAHVMVTSAWAYPIPRLIQRMLDELVASCPNDGCTTELPRAEIETHLRTYCQSQLISCPRKSCKQGIERRYKDDECRHRKIRCRYCFAEIMIKDKTV